MGHRRPRGGGEHLVTLSQHDADHVRSLRLCEGRAPQDDLQHRPELAPTVRVNAIYVGGGHTVAREHGHRRRPSPAVRRWTPMGRPGEQRTSHVLCCIWCPTRRSGSRARCSRSMVAPRLVRCRIHRTSSNPGAQEVPECELPPYSSLTFARLRSLWAGGAGGPLGHASTVVEPKWVVADECSLSRRPCTRQRFRREVVDRGRRSDSLGDIATPIVALDEHPSRVTGPR